MKIELQLHGLDGVLATLQSLPPEIVSKRGGPVKSALRKGAVLILKAEKAQLQVVTSNMRSGRSLFAHNALAHAGLLSSGLLLKNVVATRGRPPPGGNGERYLVRVKRKLYGRSGQPVSTLDTARFLEYGTAKQPAEPWIRPAFQANARSAIETIERETVKGIDRVVKKLAAQNKGR